ncbi:TPA: helix-turn-helix transcriptional regulator [Mannheimia haemolytica]|uniref:S24 family peptidase n=1 Tax=Mannheimia haemolytica TaxID=75985 RepID=UPI0001594C06|nr:S24 family peptidase [Mannheimia haemolytica]AWW71173.1 helix-turn-helix transcriptional regulator [Pasteurellaceae bacterium 12565]AGI32291.2 transcriptional regulator [Mannheimia haemolytica USDA-ARS-USMARC-183]AGI35686.2 transcriptional regulator [Mannheimia haemolytica USDA-ARS-USMARC-185]AGK02140.1 26 kDa repressor protein [Mannheimia haemolytica M42548]AGQ24388.1 tRNA processing ribonuclease BN [Mannheimia haemolytica D153]
MRPLKEIRYDNLLRLIDEAKSTSDLANRTGIAVSYLLQIKNKNAIQNGKPKGIGDKIAAKLEDGMNKPRGWLDQIHSEQSNLINSRIGNEEQKLQEQDLNDFIIIDVLDVSASAGFGSSSELVEVVNQMRYVPEQFYSLFRNMAPRYIRIINLSGDSMYPTFSSGDMLFVDISVNEFTGDGVYVFTYKGHLYVKRLQNTGDQILVISDNKLYEKWSITEENQDQLFIHARVKVHQSQQLNFIG